MKHTVRSAVCALLCAAVMLLAPAASLGESAPKDYAASVQPDTHDQALQALVTVQTYVDGDTTHFLLPEDIMEERVISARYLAVNTPECTGRIEEYGKAAAAFTREKLEKSYVRTGEPYTRTFDYDPTLKCTATGERREIMKYAMGVVSSGGSRIRAMQLKRHVKLFTAWDEEKYYSGNPGDYIACREDDIHDIYIIRARLFPELYRKV